MGEEGEGMGWERREKGWDGRGGRRDGMGEEGEGMGWERREKGWDGRGGRRDGRRGERVKIQGKIKSRK